MLNMILEILSILGILLLCLLGLAVLLILLVLFFPISYRLSGKKNGDEMTVSARALWLFGFLRVSFDHPEPGRILVKILPFTVFDSGKSTDGKAKKASGNASSDRSLTEDASLKPEKTVCRSQEEAGREISKASGAPEAEADGPEPEQTKPDRTSSENTEPTDKSSDSSNDGGSEDDADSRILKKFKKIKYPICSIYDKIKNIWENISYYIELLQEKETKLLFSHVIFRLGKIWKGIRPRHIRGQILFGTGSPDTTGYAYGVYGMLSPLLGSSLSVTPDFTGAVLEGDIFISGHITIFTILWNVLRVLADKNLRRFVRKMKAGRKK
ncbi:MAG: DUF2953 domain-containing protein [Acetatifactor sp.]|nr:DUF2953 domain-containing protein [Acetatifactor sp.]